MPQASGRLRRLSALRLALMTQPSRLTTGPGYEGEAQAGWVYGVLTLTTSGLTIAVGLVAAPIGTGVATKCSYTVSLR